MFVILFLGNHTPLFPHLKRGEGGSSQVMIAKTTTSLGVTKHTYTHIHTGTCSTKPSTSEGEIRSLKKNMVRKILFY